MGTMSIIFVQEDLELVKDQHSPYPAQVGGEKTQRLHFCKGREIV
jgi:hypothetical protein